MQGVHGKMVSLLPSAGLSSKKLPEPAPMYPDEGKRPQKRGAAHAMAAKEAIPFGH